MELNYNKLLILDLKSIFNFENSFGSNKDLTSYIKQISADLENDIENIKNRINSLKTVNSKLDFIYKHIYHVENLKLQFTKKIKMKKQIEKYMNSVNENSDFKNHEFVNKVSLRFRFNILSLETVEFGFYVLGEIKKIVSEFLISLKALSKKTLEKVYHPERIDFDVEIIILFIKAMVKLKIAKNQHGKNVKSSKMVKILMKIFLLRKSDGTEYTEQSLIKKLSKKYVLKKNINDFNNFKEKVQKFQNDISATPYIKGLQERLIKKIQN